MNLLIIGAVVLVIADAIVLAIGWSSANEPLIFTSIGASILAFLLVAIAWFKDRRQTRRPVVVDRVGPGAAKTAPDKTAAGKPQRSAGETSSWARGERRPAQPPAPVSTAATEAPEESIAATTTAAVAQKKPAPRAKKTASRRPAATVGGAAAQKASAPADTAAVAASDDVIAVPDRKRFHRRECRYATAKGAERMSKASARRRGYAACGVCKP